jgi:hypothetical protein
MPPLYYFQDNKISVKNLTVASCHVEDIQKLKEKIRCSPAGAVENDSSQVKLLITNNAFFIVQRATAQSKTGIFRGYGVAEAPPGFQVGWSDCKYFFSLFLFILFAHLELMQPRHSSP